jgi:hypothetical protein
VPVFNDLKLKGPAFNEEIDGRHFAESHYECSTYTSTYILLGD